MKIEPYLFLIENLELTDQERIEMEANARFCSALIQTALDRAIQSEASLEHFLGYAWIDGYLAASPHGHRIH